jgi:ABC-2 type transport system ATP-binding protein
VIVVRDLIKVFGTTPALRGVSFTVNKGEVFGFIGPNGAGKTTTIRILATLLEPTRGSASINGINVFAQPFAVRRVIGYMPDSFDVYPSLTVAEYLDFFAALYGFDRRARAAIVDQILELTDLKVVRNKLAGALSRGMRQRLCMAKTLVHDPKVLILDEPASGLDPRARIEFRTLVKELQKMGKTILISSHILTELAEMCNAVAIIERGKIRTWGQIDHIIDSVRPVRKLKIDVLDRAAEAAETARRFPESLKCEVENHILTIDFKGDRPRIAELVRELVTRGVPVVTVEEEKTNLENLFMSLTKDEVA